MKLLNIIKLRKLAQIQERANDFVDKKYKSSKFSGSIYKFGNNNTIEVLET